MGILGRAIRRTMDLALGEAKALNKGPQEGSPDAASLQRAINALKAEAFDIEGGRIDYTKLKGTPGYAAYQRQAASLRSFDPRSLSSLEEKTAFWINIYNTLTIDGVISFGIRESVREVPRLGFFRKAAYLIGGDLFSLDDIEHGVLRGNRRHPAYPVPQFDEEDPRRYAVLPLNPKIHFALTCASRSCPPIGFYDAERLANQLDIAMANFLTGGGCEIDMPRGILSLSSIFKWYAQDFAGEGGVLGFLARNHPDAEARALLAGRARSFRVAYMPYDWRLNRLSA